VKREDEDFVCPILEDLVDVHTLLHEAMVHLGSSCVEPVNDLTKALYLVLSGRNRFVAAFALLRVLLQIANDDGLPTPNYKM
jgi:hypothetical protein